MRVDLGRGLVAQRLATQHAAVHGLCSVCSGSAPVLALEGTLTLELIRLYTEPRGGACVSGPVRACARFSLFAFWNVWILV